MTLRGFVVTGVACAINLSCLDTGEVPNPSTGVVKTSGGLEATPLGRERQWHAALHQQRPIRCASATNHGNQGLAAGGRVIPNRMYAARLGDQVVGV